MKRAGRQMEGKKQAQVILEGPWVVCEAEFQDFIVGEEIWGLEAEQIRPLDNGAGGKTEFIARLNYTELGRNRGRIADSSMNCVSQPTTCKAHFPLVMVKKSGIESPP